jgi:hypothetical protein
MEPDDNLWGCLVRPPQLQHISHMARGHTNLTHVDIQGKPGGDPGVQQQQGSVQETWGESRWEEIVHIPLQGEVDLTTPPTRRQTHQDQRRHNAQQAGRYQNTTTSSTVVRKNLASHLQGAYMCQVELIPMDKQIRAATIYTMQNLLVYNCRGGRILCNSRGGPCNKDKGRGDGAGALKWMAGHTGTCRRQRTTILFVWDVKMLTA